MFIGFLREYPVDIILLQKMLKRRFPPGGVFSYVYIVNQNSNVKRFFLKIWPWVKNKYILTISVFTIWMLFFDQNNVVDRLKMSGEIRQLEADRQYYLEEIEKDSARFHELTTDKDNLEKYAREQFLMKKKNEDVFLVIEEE